MPNPLTTYRHQGSFVEPGPSKLGPGAIAGRWSQHTLLAGIVDVTAFSVVVINVKAFQIGVASLICTVSSASARGGNEHKKKQIARPCKEKGLFTILI